MSALSVTEGFGAISASHCGNKNKTSPTSFCHRISVSSSSSFLQAFGLCRTAADDRSSDILKMAAFAKLPLLHETRPSSTKLQLINVPFHSSHSTFQRVCVRLQTNCFHGCFCDAVNLLHVFRWRNNRTFSRSAALFCRNLEIFH